jgi:hypothetical protein
VAWIREWTTAFFFFSISELEKEENLIALFAKETERKRAPPSDQPASGFTGSI